MIGFAQRPFTPNNTNTSYPNYNITKDSVDTDSINAILDSIPLPKFEYNYYYINDPSQSYLRTDTSLGHFFQEVDPARKRKFNFLQTGNAGAAALSSIYDFRPQTGFQLGYHQYDYLNFSVDSLKFYNSERPFSDLYFSPIFGSQENFMVGAEYGQKFNDGTAVSLNYRRIAHKGFYQEQTTKSTNFALAFRYQTKNKRLNFFTGIVSNVNAENHDGGVDSLHLIHLPNYVFRQSMPVKLEQASTRQDYKELFLVTTLSLDGKNTDTSRFSIGHTLRYKYGQYKFSDNGISNRSDSLFYGDYVIHPKGIRNQSSLDLISNEFFLKSNWSFGSGKVSLVHDLFKLTSGTYDKSINDLTLKFRGGFNIKKSFVLQTEAALGLGANVGNFLIKGSNNFHLGKYADLGAFVSFYRSQNGWNEERLILNDNDYYNYNFKTPFGSAYEATLSVKALGLQVGLGQQLVNNVIYRDTFARPIQDDGVFVATRLFLSHRLSIWKVHFENHAFVQSLNASFLALPGQFLKSNLYLETTFFKKKLLLRVGAEFRHFPSFTLPEFDPVTGAYYKGNNSYKASYTSADAYILGKVSKFRVAFKMENFQDYFNEQINYLSVYHPQFDRKIRLNFSWLLLD